MMELTSVMMISKLKPSNRTGPFTACAMSMTAPKFHLLNTPTACASGRGVLYSQVQFIYEFWTPAVVTTKFMNFRKL